MCGGVFTGLSGTITSPGYPNNYPNSAICGYDIHVPRNMRIHLEFDVFYLGSCCDKLQIQQMISGTNYIVAELTGSAATQRNFTSAENRFTLYFTTDYSGTSRGFRANYYAIQSGKQVQMFVWISLLCVTHSLRYVSTHILL